MCRPNALLLTCLLMIVTGCTRTAAPTLQKALPQGWQWFNGEDQEYGIGVPPDFEIGKHAIQGVIQGPGFFADATGMDVKIYSNASLALRSRGERVCSPSLTGASDMQKLPGEGAEMGKVDYYDVPPIDRIPTQPVCSYPSSSGSVYAFCSSTHNKIVIICISQMTDNPDLATQIFVTFRWTE